MSTIAENLQSILDSKSALATNLTNAKIPSTTDEPLQTLVDKIPDIGEWQPEPDWWDIETIVETGVVPWLETPLTNIRYAYVLVDAELTAVLPAGCSYYTSDGTYYANGGTHTWNVNYDKICSKGYKTRCVVVCSPSNQDNLRIELTPDSWYIPSLYIYIGDCFIYAMTFASNLSIRAVKCNSKTRIDYNGVLDSCFYSCYSLYTVDIPNGATILQQNCFYGCANLKDVTIPNGISSIPSYMFRNCYTISSFNIPNSVTSIGDLAFSNCRCITSISIPSSVVSILLTSFNYCVNIYNFNVYENFDIAISLTYSELSISCMLDLFSKLKDNTGNTAKTLTIGTDNLAKLTTEQKAIATNKNWTLA